MLPINLGKSDHCRRCGQLRHSQELIYEGPDLEPVCLDCLRQLDPERAALLETLRPHRPG